MKHKIKFNLIFSSLFLFITAIPAFAKGPAGSVIGIPCDGVNCNIEDIFTLINNLIKFAITKLFFPIFIVAILYIGWSYLTAGGDTKKVANVKQMAWHMFLGVILVLASWLIVKTVLDVLGATDAGMFLTGN
ncbi:MAG: hypothetical protein WCQ32_01550 [bacterium]